MTQAFEGIAHRDDEQRVALGQGFAGLARAAQAVGARNVAVLVLDSASVEVVYRRTEAVAALALGVPIPCGSDICVALNKGSGKVLAGSPMARFLTTVVALTATSFLLFRWRSRPGGVTVVFGFEAQEPADAIPPHVADSVNLAALATWSLRELSRLRLELRQANHRFAGRKLVERAKGVLQTENGFSEQEAYEYLRRLSRQRRLSLSELAQDLLGSARWP